MADWPKLATPGISSSAPRLFGTRSTERRANWKRNSLTKAEPRTACHPAAKDWSWLRLVPRTDCSLKLSAPRTSREMRARETAQRAMTSLAEPRRCVSFNEVWVEIDSEGKRPSETEWTAARSNWGDANAKLMRAAAPGTAISEYSSPDSRCASMVVAKKV